MDLIPHHDNGSQQEQILLEKLTRGINCEEASPVFILAPPRSGSTLFYQQCILAFGFSYISNHTNDYFASTPILGFKSQEAIARPLDIKPSYFGKVDGSASPSEGSLVFKFWYGGLHPSETRSRKLRPNKKVHFIQTMNAVEQLTKRSLITKNAWNCFRVSSLRAALPRAKFLWLRRDIGDAAYSDLMARSQTKGSADVWTSASPANVLELKKLPPWQQVIESQYQYNRVLEKSFKKLTPECSHTVWYEDLCEHPIKVISSLAEFFGKKPMNLSLIQNSIEPDRILKKLSSSSEKEQIYKYIHHQETRFFSDIKYIE